MEVEGSKIIQFIYTAPVWALDNIDKGTSSRKAIYNGKFKLTKRHHNHSPTMIIITIYQPNFQNHIVWTGPTSSQPQQPPNVTTLVSPPQQLHPLLLRLQLFQKNSHNPFSNISRFRSPKITTVASTLHTPSTLSHHSPNWHVLCKVQTT